jgi:hypothetical protein
MVRKTRIHFPGTPLPHRGFSDYDNWRSLSLIGQLARLSEQQDPLPDKIPLKYLTAKNSAPATMAIRIIFWIIIHLIPKDAATRGQLSAPAFFPGSRPGGTIPAPESFLHGR